MIRLSENPGLRADAVRNRDVLLQAATRAFACADAEPSMRAVAREAGVGIATLYRHFPTRESLVDAVYRDQVDRLTRGADDLLSQFAPAEALRRWMDLFGDWLVTKHGMVDTLREMIDAGSLAHLETRDQLLAAIRRQRRYRQAKDLPVDDRVEPQIGFPDPLINRRNVAAIPDLNRNHARLWHRNGRHLIEGHPGAVDHHLNRIEQIGACPAGAQPGQFSFQGIDRCAHALLDFIDIVRNQRHASSSQRTLFAAATAATTRGAEAGTLPRISTGGLDDRLTRFSAQHFQEIARFFDGNHN